MSSLPIAALAGHGFTSDPRFSFEATSSGPSTGPADPVAEAWDQGFAAGQAEASEAALAAAEAEAAARGRIELSLARLDAELAEQLRQKLTATVEALCEAAIAPVALDRKALAVRIDRAAAMLARADDHRVLRMHPEDLKLVIKQLPQGLETLEDGSLDRGTIRIETASGGVEDGPAHWRRAIAEALAAC